MFNCKKSNPGIELKNRIEVQNQIELKIELRLQATLSIFEIEIAGYTKYFWNIWRAIVSVVLELPFLHL